MAKLRVVVLLVAALIVAAAFAALLGFDADGDGVGDTVRLGPWNLQAALLPADLGIAAREYQLPPRYVHLIVGKAFRWDSGWTVEQQDDSSITSALRRKADGARLEVSIEAAPAGSAVVRMTIRGADSRPALGEAFEVLESILWHRLPRPAIQLWGPQE